MDVSDISELTDSRAQDVAEVIEQAAAWFSSLGFPRAAGQMFGYLLVCDPPEQSAGQVAAATGLSRASVSSSARSLLAANVLQQRHRVGDRKTYYRLRHDWWIATATAQLSGFERLAEAGRRLRAAGALARTDGLDDMIEFSEFWNEEIPKLAQRWAQRQARIRHEGR